MVEANGDTHTTSVSMVLIVLLRPTLDLAPVYTVLPHHAADNGHLDQDLVYELDECPMYASDIYGIMLTDS
jgi:hypothetical protein